MLWCGTNGSLFRYDGTTFTSYTTSDGLGSHDVWGATRFDGASFVTISEEDGLGNGHVQSLLEDRSGRLWIGTSGGAYRWVA